MSKPKKRKEFSTQEKTDLQQHLCQHWDSSTVHGNTRWG